MGIQVFTVLSEFQFEAGAAIAESGKLQNAVEGVSTAAMQAQQTIQAMGVGIISSFISGPGGGVLGVLGAALFTFDKFQQKQIQVANILNQNGLGFAQNMEIADKILEDINAKALKFGLPTEDLINVVKLIGPQLMNKGLAGDNLSGATNLGRSFLKASPILGIDPNEAFGQLQRAIEGQASGGDTMFNRLAGETQAMKAFVGNAKAFNALNPAKRVATLNAAFGQFSNNTAAVDARLMSLTGQIQVFKNQVSGAFSILRPIGEALSKAVLPAFIAINKFIKDKLSISFKILGRTFQNLIPDVRTFLITLASMRDMKDNFLSAGKILGVVGALEGLNWILGTLGISIPILTPLLASFVKGVHYLTGAFAFGTGTIATWGGLLNSIVMLVSKILAPLALLLIVFDLISRAIAIAKIDDALAIADMIPQFAELTARFSAIFDVFSQGMNNIAALIAPIFRLSMYAEGLVWVLERVSEIIGLAMASFQGLVFVIMEFVNQISSFIGGGKFDTSAIGTAGNAGIDEMIAKIFGKVAEGESIGGNVTNIGKVEIKQDFKQQQEPDRIAFTVADTLMKLARNPTQAVNSGFATSGTGKQ